MVFTTGIGLTTAVFELVPTQPPVVTVSETTKVPADEYVCEGACVLSSGDPSPKSQLYVVPVVVLLNALAVPRQTAGTLKDGAGAGLTVILAVVDAVQVPTDTTTV
jgi:hypothetical protein